MTYKCAKCERTESQIASDAESLGLMQEFQAGVYTCCEIVAWADEQSSAWLDATQEDSRPLTDLTSRPQFESREIESALVPVRLRLRQVPWYRQS